MNSGYILKLGLKIRLINVRTQKIDGSTFKIFEMVLTSFQVNDILKRARFFQKIFLLADFNIKLVLEILFLILNNANIKFA